MNFYIGVDLHQNKFLYFIYQDSDIKHKAEVIINLLMNRRKSITYINHHQNEI